MSHDHDHDDESSERSDDGIRQRFWSATVGGDVKEASFTLHAAELHITNVCLAAPPSAGKDSARTASVFISTAHSGPSVIAHLSTATPQALLDIALFPEDENVKFTVTGAAVTLVGSMAVASDEVPNDDDEDEEEGEDEEAEESEEEKEAAATASINKRVADSVEAPEGKPAKLAATAPPALSATEKLKRKRDESGEVVVANRREKVTKHEAEEDVAAARKAAADARKSPEAPARSKASASAAKETGSLVTLADGKLKYKELVSGRGAAARKGAKVVVK